MRIGLFGGTFDPIHLGHLRSAEEVRETFSLDRVVFIPAARPPLKKRRPAAPAEDRLKMARLAISRNPGFTLSDVEFKRSGKSYSIDTVRYYARRHRGDSLYFIVGLDAFRDIGSWKDVQSLFGLCNFIATSRPGSGDSFTLESIPVAVRGGFCYDRATQSFQHYSGTRLFFTRITDIGISASEIRARLSRGKSIRYLVPGGVEAYIEKRGLYGRPLEGRS
ncbi:MAG TPA: nicotinate-nucleotide adenylyltransferase [Candidatus Binatia bacterium]